MRIAGVFSFKDGEKEVTKHYADLLTEVNEVIKTVDAAQHKTKESVEKTMKGQMLFSPKRPSRKPFIGQASLLPSLFFGACDSARASPARLLDGL
jgi:hypothetical protein